MVAQCLVRGEKCDNPDHPREKHGVSHRSNFRDTDKDTVHDEGYDTKQRRQCDPCRKL